MATTKIQTVYSQIARYCSYQERTEKEVQVKLQALGITQAMEQHQLIQTLKNEKFLDDERYVASFIRGRLVHKYWGKRKLQLALASKGIDTALIQKGLAAINDDDYMQGLRKVAVCKIQALAGKDYKQQKLTNYLLQKGYEPDLVSQMVQELIVARPT